MAHNKTVGLDNMQPKVGIPGIAERYQAMRKEFHLFGQTMVE